MNNIDILNILFPFRCERVIYGQTFVDVSEESSTLYETFNGDVRLVVRHLQALLYGNLQIVSKICVLLLF